MLHLMRSTTSPRSVTILQNASSPASRCGGSVEQKEGGGAGVGEVQVAEVFWRPVAHSCNPVFKSPVSRPLLSPPSERARPPPPSLPERRPTSGPWLPWSARPSSRTCCSPWATGASASGARARRRRCSSQDMRESTTRAVRVLVRGRICGRVLRVRCVFIGVWENARGSRSYAHAVRIYLPCRLLEFHHITRHGSYVDPDLDLKRPLLPPRRLLEPHPSRHR